MATAKKTAAKKVATPILKDVYVAFSIAGSNTFITASMKQQNEQQIADILKMKLGDTFLFSLANSRRPGFDDSKEVKLNFIALNNKDGTPTKSHIKVAQGFKILKDFGWTVDKEAFVNKHWPSK